MKVSIDGLSLISEDDFADDEFEESFELLGGPSTSGRATTPPRRSCARRLIKHVKLASLTLVGGIVLGCLLFFGGSHHGDQPTQQQQQQPIGESLDASFIEAVKANHERYFTRPNIIHGVPKTEAAAAHDDNDTNGSTSTSSSTPGGAGGSSDIDAKTDESPNDIKVDVKEEGAADKFTSGTHQDNAAHTSSTAAPPEAATIIHPQCVHLDDLTSSGSSNNAPDRPILILKYARTGSTWLVWSGQTLRLSNNRTMVWTSEVQACGEPYSDDLLRWFVEYYNPSDRDVRMRLNGRPDYQNPKCPLSGAKLYVDHVSKDLDRHERRHDRKVELGSFVSTIDWKISVRDTDEDGNETLTTLDWHTDDPYHREGDGVLGKEAPDLSLAQWGQLFQSVPDLALGVLVRTNSVKRAISRLESEEQVRICGAKKLRGDEECLKDLPDKVYINTTDLWEDIRLNDMKRDILPKMVAHLSTTFNKGKIFCLSYESMQRDIAGQMEGLGKFLGADIDGQSLDGLRENAGKTSYKRGSDDLSQYLANYDEVRDSLSDYPCLLEQLEDKSKGRDFPPCKLWQ